MDISCKELAALLNAEIDGDPDVRISNVRGITDAQEGDLTFVIDKKYVPAIATTKASAILIRADIQATAPITLIRVKDPRAAFQTLAKAFAPPPPQFAPGVHPSAVVADDAILGDNVSVQPYAIIEPGVTIGDNCIIHAHTYIGHHTRIGNDCIIYPQVTIRDYCTIGNRVILHPGVVIGGDGFGYDQVEGKNIKIPQIGTVLIEDDVEIGANTTVDRARFDKTVIRRGTKIDNLVMIAHNCEIGEDSILCGQVGLSGTAKVGNRVILAGQAGLVGHIKVHDNIIVGAQCGVTKELTKPGFYIGSPVLPHMQYKKRESVFMKLPDIYRRLKKIEEAIATLLSTTKKDAE